MKYNKPSSIENTVNKIFGTGKTDEKLTELLDKIVKNREAIKQAIKASNYDVMQNTFLRLSILNSELADYIADQHILVGSLNAGMEFEKEARYREEVQRGASANSAYQISGRLTKEAEAEYVYQKGLLHSLTTIAESIRYLISDVKARLEYEKGNIMNNNRRQNYENN